MPIEVPSVRILIVDDDKAICDYMQTLLEKDGFIVKTMSDSTLVEDEVRTGDYHVMILDLMMPKLDGIEVLKRIHAVDNDITMMIFTTHPNLDSAMASMKLNAIDYLKK
ncbi:MAG TPA: response regulator, partial [Polyangiaceae bacterium]|nr:response regulator [Polyangiaceae bacterium]